MCAPPARRGSRRAWGWVLCVALAHTAWLPLAVADDWRARGTVAFRGGDLDGALAAFTRAAVVAPEDAVLWNNVAVVLWRLGEGDAARLAVAEALAMRTPYPEAIANQRHFAGHDAPQAKAGIPHGEVRFLRALLDRRRQARVAARTPVAAPPSVAVQAKSNAPGPPLTVETAAPDLPPTPPQPRPLQRMVARYEPVRPAAPPTVANRPPLPSLLPTAMAQHESPAEAVAVAPVPVAEATQAEGEPSSEAVPAALVYLPAGVPDVLVVDKGAHRLYHYRGTVAGPRQVASYSCVVGKNAGRKEVAGDLRTPEGVYFIEELLTDTQLAPRYGVLAYPTDYPNSFDHIAGRRGNGIWLHGTDEPERLALRDDSQGCVVLANDDLLSLSRAVREGRTPMVVVAAIDWVEPQASATRAAQITGWLDGWRADWEQGDLEAYRARYGREFFRLAHTRPSTWLRRKQTLLQAEGRREIELAGMTILRSGEQLVVVCSQTYRSPRHTDTGTKRIYLAADGRDYRIVAEKWLPAG